MLKLFSSVVLQAWGILGEGNFYGETKQIHTKREKAFSFDGVYEAN